MTTADPTEDKGELDPRFLAAMDLIRRTGATEVQIRYSDDEEPVVWFVVASFDDPTALGQGKIPPRKKALQIGAGIGPTSAALKCAEVLVTGAECTWCHRRSAMTTDFQLKPLPADICWYVYDPDTALFKRGCEDDPPPPKRDSRLQGEVPMHSTGQTYPAEAMSGRMPAKIPGQHRWVATTLFTVTAESVRTADDPDAVNILDRENLLHVLMGCWDCEKARGQVEVDSVCPAGDQWTLR